MLDFGAIIFDFDGVLLESEFEGNRQLAALLTDLGHRHSVEDTLKNYVGLAGQDFIVAIEKRIGAELPREFHDQMRERSRRALREGIEAVVGAVGFVQSLPADLPRAVASSSTTKWLHGHLQHLGLSDAFGSHVYSGHEHVERGKPEPDIYLYAAAQIEIPIERCVIIEDSPVGVKGALASGARVIGIAAGAHCLDGHDEMLRALGVKEIAYSFGDVRRLLGL
jgi:HAD superfamily hydrolase (TIGR01509 family)